MEMTIFFLLNIALVLGCIIMGLIFLVLPLPSISGLRNYRISLKVLALAYILQGALSIIPLVLKYPEVRLLEPLELIISSSQAILFAFTLITLFNPSFVTSRLIFRHLLPVLLFIVLLLFFTYIWGNPALDTLNSLYDHTTHPTIILRISFTLFYIFQLFYFTKLFFGEEKKYEQQLDNFFADNYRLYLKWVRYCFYAALLVGIIALSSFFFYSSVWVTTSAGIYAFFYVGFGLFYIQYPNTFIEIEKAIEKTELAIVDETEKNQRQLTWDKLKQQVIDEKYYLKPGVNIEELAQHLKIGRTTLSVLINKEEGINFNFWMNTLRINEAKKLLAANPDFSIAQVSEMVGFSEQSNFSRQFKLITQQSPSEWKQQNIT